MEREFDLAFIKLHILYHAAKEEIYGMGMIEELGRHGYRLSPGTLYPALAKKLYRSKLAAGAYEECETPRHLAAVIWDQLEAYERHFHVGWSPAGVTEPVMSHSEEELDAWRKWSKLQNFGFKRVEVLPGNVGYLDLRYFDDTALAGDTATAAMGLLANTDAVIVDVREPFEWAMGTLPDSVLVKLGSLPDKLDEFDHDVRF